MTKKLALMLGLGFLTACTQYSTRPPALSRSTPRDRYEAQLVKDGWGESGQLKAWQVAGRRALRERLSIEPSFREIVRFAAADPQAVGYRLPLKRGQRVSVSLERLEGQRGRVFAEIFQEFNPPSAMFMPAFGAHPDARSFDFEPRSDGEYVIRVQPAIDQGGTYRITVRTAAGLTFPVVSANLKSIGSFFGDPRDGGRRDHEGVDIFAPRGTPVVAVAPGIIAAVRTTSVGGRVVWQRDDARGVTYYYAHLQTQNVREGQRVAAGDPIGTVGNTGNARTTPPHLHFSVYRPGQIALDPVPFLYNQPGNPVEPVLADTDGLGTWTRVSGDAALRSSPSTNSRVLAELDHNQRVLLISGVRDWHRVALEDGTTGFVSTRLLSTP